MENIEKGKYLLKIGSYKFRCQDDIKFKRLLNTCFKYSIDKKRLYDTIKSNMEKINDKESIKIIKELYGNIYEP